MRVSGVLSTNREVSLTDTLHNMDSSETMTSALDQTRGYRLGLGISTLRTSPSAVEFNPSLEPATRHGKRRESPHLRSYQTRNNTKNNTNNNDNRCVNNNHDSVTQVITRGCAQRRGSAVHIPEPGLERYTSPRTRARGVTGVG